MTGAIVFQCTAWIGAGTFGPAHRCGAISRSLDEYVRHYQERHDIARYAPAPPPAQRETARGTGQVSGHNEQTEGANAA